MIKIPAINGTYELKCDSNGTYHEIVAKLSGTFAAKASVSILRLGSSQVELLNSLPVDVSVVSSGLIFGSLEKVFVTISEASGSGYAEVTLTSREFGVPDNMSRSRAYVQSIAREYPAGVALVSQGRPRLNYVSVQNRDNQTIYFWHGLVPTSMAQTSYLPLDPYTWTAQQKLDAGLLIQTYGEAVAAGASYEPNVAQTGPLYSYVAANTAKAHVKVG